jgi:hypothetical protein
MLPDNAPPEYVDRAVLWNAVEEIEKANNSQLAREIELALPVELMRGQNISLVNDYCRKHFVNHGMVADIAIHDTGNGNPHAHVMLTMRPFNEDRTWGAKQRKVYLYDENGEKIYDPKKRQYKCTKQETTDWNNRANANEWREAWADEVNAVLERENHTERIDHRSHKDRGLDEQPTIHLGIAASQMERKGIRSEKGNRNRKIADFNSELRQLKAQLNKLDEWLKEEMQKSETPAPPSLFDVVQSILNRQAQKGKSQHYQSINNVKASAKMMNFLTENKIQDFPELQEKLQSMIGKQRDISHELKPIERRIKTLDEHIKQSENYKKHRAVYEKYNAIQPTFADKLLKRDPKEDFHLIHSVEITLFEAADRYLKEHLNGKVMTPPLKKWKAEREEKTAEKDRLYRQYNTLKNEVKEVEQIKKNVYDILQQENREQQQQKRSHDMEL